MVLIIDNISSIELERDDSSSSLPSSVFEVRLSNGNAFPLVGIGAGNIPHQKIPRVISKSLSNVRLIDTARSSSNEALVSRAVQRWLKSQDHVALSNGEENIIHIVTKVWYTHLGYERTNLSVRESMNDLSSILKSPPGKKWSVRVHVLLQWPRCSDDVDWMNCQREEDRLSEHIRNIGPSPLLDRDNAWKGSWRALEEMYNAGILESIGISNFSLEEMLELLDMCTVKPHLFQGNLYNVIYDKPLMDLLKKHEIFFQAYNIFKDTIKNKDIAKRAYGALQRVGMSQKQSSPSSALHHQVYSPATVVMCWLLQRGIGVVPGTSDEKHIDENSPQTLLVHFPSLSARHDMDLENAIGHLIKSNRKSNEASDSASSENEDYSAVDPNKGVVATFFNTFSNRSVKLFLIAKAGIDAHNSVGIVKHIPVSLWMEPGSSIRVIANPKDIFVVYDGYGNAVKEFWVSQEHGGEETFSIEL